MMRRAAKYFREVFSRYDDLNESVQENITGIRVVKSFVREEYENDKFKKAVGTLYRSFIRAEKLVVTNMPVMMGSVYACILLLSWFRAKMITAGDLTTGGLMSLLAYCMTILINLMMVSVLIVMFTMSEASITRIAEVLDTSVDRLLGLEEVELDIPDMVKVCYCKDCQKHNKGIEDVRLYGEACPLVRYRGRAQGHEFDYQWCVYGARKL